MSVPASSAADMYCRHLPGPSLITAFPPISEMAPTSHCLEGPAPLQGHDWASYLCWLCTLAVASCVSSPTMKWVRCAGCQLHLDIVGSQSFRMTGQATPGYWTVGYLVKWAHRQQMAVACG